jgi:hypothetical protein
MVADIVDDCSFRIGTGQIVVLHGVAPHVPLSPEAARGRQRLEELLLHRHVQLEEVELDARGRVIARVWAEGDDINDQLQRMARPLACPRPETECEPKKVEVAIDASVFDSESGGPKPERQS